ncbi:hypothetical protein E5347_11585 [Clostridium sartagoforme]|uniref:SpaA-like prealbumin fold domain-containing protein n=1 Tax=Clostridium sartagoforme TaxID=84031 RepID=A0A4S2DHQ0_9CLOT|nr:SpaA isopeptide-forming pilin-related protein [Clostridium sartagoforme]TGY41647.1 hypothetical protein E5347_11585 [Clostridium sartagoforme]
MKLRKVKRVTAFILSALMMLINMTNITYAEENVVYEVGIGKMVGIVEAANDPGENMSVADPDIAELVFAIDNKDGKWKVMAKGLKIGETTASIKLVGETSAKTYSIKVVDGSIKDGVQRISANNLTWTPVSGKNPLGGADDFSALFFNEFKDFNETGGPVVAKKITNVKISTFDKGLIGGINQFDDIEIPQFNVGLIAQESINGDSKILISNGDVVVGTNVDISKLDVKDKEGVIYKNQEQIDSFLKDARSDLIKLNNDLWNKEITSKTKYDDKTITFDLVNGLNVFEVDFSSGRKNINFNYINDDAKNSTIIIKVKGNIVDYKDMFLNGKILHSENTDNLANRIIWTFDPSIKGNDIDIEVKNTIVRGSLLAPSANIAFTSGYCAIDGTIIANGLDASNGSTNSEIHWVGRFMGNFGNEPIEETGSFQFNKKDNHGNVVSGAEFSLYQDEEVKYTATSTGTGVVSFSGIKEGNYILKETKAPDGYEISTDEIIVTVDKDGIVTFNLDGEEEALTDLNGIFVNNISKTEFSFSKVVSGTDTGIPGVEFKLMQDNKEVATAVSNENGVVSFENIELGTYTLIETTPTGYKEAGPWTVNVTKEGTFIDESKLEIIENEKIIEKTGSFQFNKNDNYRNPVNGAEFALYQDEEVKYTAISTDTGLVSFSGIKEGTYTLKETSAPKGYEVSKVEVEVTVNSDGTVTFKESGVVKTDEDLESLYINKMILGRISFTKYINDKKGILAGAEFELLINGERYGVTVFSDVNGLVTFLNVKPGEYEIREVSSHSKYFKASDKAFTVVIDENGVSSLVGEAKTEAETLFINKVENSIQFIKYGDNNSVLSNATFELLKGTEVIATSISDKNGVVRFENILPGEYIVREKSAPNGYIKSEATRRLVVKDNGEVSITDSEIKEWEEAFKNKADKSEEGPIEENDNTTNNNEDKITVPQTSDETNVIFPVLAAFLSLAGIFLIRKIK